MQELALLSQQTSAGAIQNLPKMIKQIEDLEKENIALKSKVSNEEAKVSDLQAKVSNLEAKNAQISK